MTRKKLSLHGILKEDELCDALLLVCANKMDLLHALSLTELASKLRLEELKGRKWHLQPASAVSADGLIDWTGQSNAQDKEKVRKETCLEFSCPTRCSKIRTTVEKLIFLLLEDSFAATQTLHILQTHNMQQRWHTRTNCVQVSLAAQSDGKIQCQSID